MINHNNYLLVEHNRNSVNPTRSGTVKTFSEQIFSHLNCHIDINFLSCWARGWKKSQCPIWDHAGERVWMRLGYKIHLIVS